MAYHKTLLVSKIKITDELPENPEWIQYRNEMIESGRILMWDMSKFTNEGYGSGTHATIDVVTDSEGTWHEIFETSERIRNKGRFLVKTIS